MFSKMSPGGSSVDSMSSDGSVVLLVLEPKMMIGGSIDVGMSSAMIQFS